MRQKRAPPMSASRGLKRYQTLSLKASSMLRKLGAYRQQNRLHLALGEIGRIARSLFMASSEGLFVGLQ